MGKGTREWNMKGEGMGSSMSLKGNRQDWISDLYYASFGCSAKKAYGCPKMDCGPSRCLSPDPHVSQLLRLCFAFFFDSTNPQSNMNVTRVASSLLQI